MKALMVNSTTVNVVTNKMRDQLYMKHLREVEKIANRQPEQLYKDIRYYHSINELHHKHKIYAFEWKNKVQHHQIDESNQKIIKKIKQIKPYTHFRQPTIHLVPLNYQNEAEAQKQEPEVHQNEERGESSPIKNRNSEKKRLPFHYNYRKRRQEEIDIQNQRLTRGILSQRSVYLPKIEAHKISKNSDKSLNLRSEERESRKSGRYGEGKGQIEEKKG